MKRLQISSVSDVTFGVHRDRSLDGLGHNFVCILGPNESGKSTLAEFLQWSIGGTEGAAATAERFILPGGGREVTGQLHGALDGDQLEIAAKFRILQKGPPNDLRLGLLSGREIDAAGIAGAFGGVNPKDYNQIHRIRGAELVRTGEADGFSTLFTQFAVGSAAASINPRARLAELQGRLRSVDQRAKALDREARELRTQISAAARRPIEVEDLEAKLTDLQLRRAEIGTRIIELQRQLALVERARSILPARVSLGIASAELERLGSMPESWRSVARISDTIRAAHTEADSARSELATIEQNFTIAHTMVGLTAEVVTRAEFSFAQRIELTAAAQKIRENTTALDRAVNERDELAVEIERHALEIRTNAANLGVAPDNSENLLGKETSLRELLTDVGIWLAAETSAVDAQGSVVACQAEMDVLRNNPSSMSTSRSRRFPARVIVLMAGLLVAAGASLVSPVAAIPVAAIAILLAILLPERAIADSASNDDALEVARRALAEATRRAEAERNRADSTGAELQLALGALGVPAVPERALARSHIQQLADLSAAVTAHAFDLARFATLNAGLLELEARMIESQSQLQRLLGDRGVLTPPSLDHFDEWLGQYEHAVLLARSLTEVSERMQMRERDRDELIEPVAQDLVDDNWPQRLARISEAAERLREIENIEAARWEAQIILNAVGDDAERIEELLHDHPDGVALDARLQVLTAEIAALDAESAQMISDGRDLELALRDLTDTEVLAALNEQFETLAEEIFDVAQSRSVVARSVDILTEVIDRFELENQAPAVKRTQRMLQEVVPDWGDLILDRDSDGKVLIERRSGADRLLETKLSDGARSLLYLALRLAFAIDDAERRNVALPILCDDPLVHLDDNRRTGAIALLADAARTHQVVLFTCDTSTAELAQQNGAHVITL